MKNQIALLFIAGVAASASQESLRVAEDAKLKADENCKSIDGESLKKLEQDTRKDRKKLLGDSVGDPSFLGVLITELRGGTENLMKALPNFARTYLQSQIKNALSLVMSVIAFITFFFFCFQVCPCFRCCRCCKKERDVSRRCTKFVAFVAFLLVAAGVVISGSLAMSSHAKVLGGVDNAVCSVSRFANSTLNGHVGDKLSNNFSGFLSVIDQVDTFYHLLSEDSSFINDIKDIITDTKPIKDALSNILRAIHTISEVLNVDKTVFGGSEFPYHRCLVCEAVADRVKTMLEDFEDTLGQKLADARQMVEDQLTAQNLEKFSSQLNELRTTLVDATDKFSENVRPALDINYIELKSNYTMPSLLAVLGVLIVAGCLVAVAMVAIFLFLTRQVRTVSSNKNPYSRCLPRTACCSFCTSCIFAIVVLLIAGVIALILPFPAVSCLLFDDMKGQDVKDIADVFDIVGIDQQKIDVWDTCFTLNGTGKVLEVVSACGESCTGDKANQTLADELEGTLQKLEGSFDRLGVNQIPKIADHPSMIKLLRALSENIGSLVLPDDTAIQKNGSLAMIARDPQGKEVKSRGMQIAFLTGLPIDGAGVTTTTLPKLTEALRDFELSQIPDIGQFRERLASFKYEMFDDQDIHEGEYRNVDNVGGSPLVPVVCPDSDAASITDTSILRGLLGMMVVCQSISEKLFEAEPEKELFDKNMKVFIHEIQQKLRGSYFNETKLRSAQDFLMNRRFPTPGDEDTMTTRPVTCDICTAGNNFIQLKKSIMKLDKLPCYKTNGPNDPASCNVTDWLDDIAASVQSLNASIAQVDKIVISLSEQIKTRLIKLVHDNFFKPTRELRDKINCKYLYAAKQDIIDGLCYDALYGLWFIVQSYVASGVLTWILGVLSFLIWRHASDNRVEWKSYDECLPRSP